MFKSLNCVYHLEKISSQATANIKSTICGSFRYAQCLGFYIHLKKIFTFLEYLHQ